ncbi:MAG: hypothetical protein ACFFE3_03540 [Candidatus Thorarchaeota archaeon]
MLSLMYHLSSVISPILTVMICYFIFRKSQWIRKRRNGIKALLLSTLVISPFLIFNQYEINAYYYGKRNVSATLFLSPGEHSKLGPLSNQGSLHDSSFWVEILVENGNVTFYIMDENRPDVFYYLDSYANESFLQVDLPYRDSEPFIMANWTANYYNPSQNQVIEVDTQILMFVLAIWPPEFEQIMRVLLIPHQILVTLWICAGVASYYQWRQKAKQEKSEL